MLNFFGGVLIEALVLGVIYLFGGFVMWNFDPSTWDPLLRFVLGGFSLYCSLQVISAVVDNR